MIKGPPRPDEEDLEQDRQQRFTREVQDVVARLKADDYEGIKFFLDGCRGTYAVRVMLSALIAQGNTTTRPGALEGLRVADNRQAEALKGRKYPYDK